MLSTVRKRIFYPPTVFAVTAAVFWNRIRYKNLSGHFKSEASEAHELLNPFWLSIVAVVVPCTDTFIAGL